MLPDDNDGYKRLIFFFIFDYDLSDDHTRLGRLGCGTECLKCGTLYMKKGAAGRARGGNKRGISLDLSIPYGARIFIQDQSLFIRLMARLYKKHIFSFVHSLSIFKEIALFKYKKIPGGR